MPHMKYSDKMARYLIAGANFLEVSVVETLDQDTCPNSWFIGDTVEEGGALYVASQINPLFLALPWLIKARNKESEDHAGYFTELDDVFSSGYTGTPLTAPLLWYFTKTPKGRASLHKICDVNLPQGGASDESIRIRLNDIKLLDWLRARVNKVAQKMNDFPSYRPVIPQNVAGAAGSAASGASAASSGLALTSALNMVSEYLPDPIFAKLVESYDLTVSSVMSANDTSLRGEKVRVTGERDLTPSSSGVAADKRKEPVGRSKTSGADSSSQTKRVALSGPPPKGSILSFFAKKA